jgi:hypothetical protein
MLTYFTFQCTQPLERLRHPSRIHKGIWLPDALCKYIPFYIQIISSDMFIIIIYSYLGNWKKGNTPNFQLIWAEITV